MKYQAFILVGLLLSTPAFAEKKEAAPKLRELINCFPAKNITKFVQKFQKLDVDKRDTVDMFFDAKFSVKDGGVLPSRMFLRDKGMETDFQMDAEGNIPNFTDVGKASETAELCSEDPSRIGTPMGTGDMNFSLTNDVHFLNNTGYHDLPALKEGLKDGKSHYKKMVPAPMRMIIPKLTYVMIEYEAEGIVPQYTAMKGQTAIKGLTHEAFCTTAMIKLKDLEALGGDGLKVMGGAYKLTPVPGPKTLAKFVDCAEEEDGEDKEE